jgi:hypothetical protein
MEIAQKITRLFLLPERARRKGVTQGQTGFVATTEKIEDFQKTVSLTNWLRAFWVSIPTIIRR